jgi:hypothetical protein
LTHCGHLFAEDQRGIRQSIAPALRQPPYGTDRLEAALARRLDRMTRQMELIERHVTISNEALTVFVAFLAGQHANLAGHGACCCPDQAWM